MASFTLPRCLPLVTLTAFQPRCKPHSDLGCHGDEPRQQFPTSKHSIPRSVSCQSAPQQASKEEDYSKALLEIYERETPVISHLLDEIDKEGAIYDKATADTPGDSQTEEERRRVVRAAVDRHFEVFSEGIVMVLAGYAQASYKEGHHRVAETLEMIREEVLDKSLSQMPPEMQALELLIGMFDQSSAARVTAAKELGQHGKGSIAQADLAALRTTASQMLEDMEEKEMIVDRQLLAKLCLVREEIDEAAGELGLLEETSTYYDMMSTTWRLLPLGPAAFVKELLHVASPEKRRALLTACVKDDFRGGSSSRDASMQRWAREGVRPGRLLNTLAALLSGLRHEGLRPDSKEVVRLQDIKADVLSLLRGTV